MGIYTRSQNICPPQVGKGVGGVSPESRGTYTPPLFGPLPRIDTRGIIQKIIETKMYKLKDGERSEPENVCFSVEKWESVEYFVGQS